MKCVVYILWSERLLQYYCGQTNDFSYRLKYIKANDDLIDAARNPTIDLSLLENREGTMWLEESYDTIIRNGMHLYYAMPYTLRNTVKQVWWPIDEIGKGHGFVAISGAEIFYPR